jgi:DNA-directed RNA polymerase subunit N (RpoN/RPB10)
MRSRHPATGSPVAGKIQGTEEAASYVFIGDVAIAGRKDWVQADLRCMMCGRVIGRLVGALPAGDPEQHTLAGRLPHFSAFRPADAGVPAIRLVGGEQFRCTTCGGAVIMDELETFTTYSDPDDEAEERPRRGRPPKPWRRGPAAPNWLDALGIAG